MLEYTLKILAGLQTSLSLTVVSLCLALGLSVFFTFILALKKRFLSSVVNTYVTVFTGTPLLIQIFLIYYGPGQFPSLGHYPYLWHFLSQPWLCAMMALTLNSAAYTTQLFYGALRALPVGQWQACESLGMSEMQSLRILMPFALKRALSSYSNEVILIFKSTSLVYTITLMDLMGYTQLLYGRTYDVKVFLVVGIIYLCINGVLTLLMRFIERKGLAFERRR